MFPYAGRVLLAALALVSTSNAGKVQKPGLRLPSSAKQNAELIKSMFVDAYSTYRYVLQFKTICVIMSRATHVFTFILCFLRVFHSRFAMYREVAFGHDDLQPVSLTFNDGRNGWGATIVDGMPTMIIMGLDVRIPMVL